MPLCQLERRFAGRVARNSARARSGGAVVRQRRPYLYAGTGPVADRLLHPGKRPKRDSSG